MEEEENLPQPRYGKVARGIQQEPEKKGEDRQRIKIWMAACMLFFAGFVDLFQALLTALAIGTVLAPVMSVGADFVLWLWCAMLGISFIKSPKRLATMLIQAVAELIPAMDALPILTAGTLLLIIITRAEDSGGIIGKVTNSVPSMKK
jgi:hypothetical protein